jgi:cysteine-S-conjugate beta-lyase
MSDDTANPARGSIRTRLVQQARPAKGQRRVVNIPVIRASTVLFEDVATQRATRTKGALGDRVVSYGTGGTPLTHALEDMITDLEGGYRTRVSGSGLTANALGMLPFLKPGDHCLITESAYEPTRKFAKTVLEPWGVSCEIYKADGSDIAGRLKPNTTLIYVETPGSATFEVIDLPALAQITKPRGIRICVDNTWGSGYLYQPLKLGADVSMLAGTKHIAGHSDVLLGAVTTTQEAWAPVNAYHSAFGICISGDDAYLALRGVRTMAVRLSAHQATTQRICTWADQRAEVANILWPAWPKHPGYALWQRDFNGACGLFALELKAPQAKVDRFIDALEYFQIGASWGGFESLVNLTNVPATRSVTDWSQRGIIVRFHAGLEDADDLIADLEQAMVHLA